MTIHFEERITPKLIRESINVAQVQLDNARRAKANPDWQRPVLQGILARRIDLLQRRIDELEQMIEGNLG